MKPQPFFWLLVIGFLPIQLLACDVCGCGSGASGIGLFWAQPRNSIQMTGFLQRFQTANESEIRTRDHFLSLNLVFRHRLTQSFYGQIALPYHSNRRDGRLGHQSIQGIGDARITGHWIAWQRDNATRSGYLEIGGGVILPTGSYDPTIHDRELPENFNPGKGSWGWSVQSQFNVNAGWLSYILQAEWKAYAPTTDGYRFGQEASATGILAVNRLRSNRLQFVPWISGSFQWVQTDQYGNGQDVHGTGGMAVLGGLGLQCTYSALAVGINAQLPVFQYFSAGEVSARTRVSVNLGWFF